MNLILLVASIICFAIATLLGFDVVTSQHILGWLSLGLLFLAASFLIGPAVAVVKRTE